MRTIFLAVCLCTLACAPVYAQQSLDHSVSSDLLLRPYIGVQGGITYSKLLGAKDFGFRYSYPYSEGQIGTLRFDDLGYGLAPLVGLSFQYPLSRHFGLIGRANLLQLASSNTETATHPENIEMQGNPLATTTNTYSKTWSYGEIEALLRFTIVPSYLYVNAGFGLATLLSDRFSGSSVLLSNNRFTSFHTSAGYQSVEVSDLTSDGYYQSLREAFKFGIGTIFTLGGSLAVTPELAVSLPLNNLFASDVQTLYENGGTTSPNLYYASFSVGINLPVGRAREFTDVIEPMVVEMDDQSSTSTSRSRSDIAGSNGSVTIDTTGMADRLRNRLEAIILGVVRDELSHQPIQATITATDLDAGTTAATTQTDASGSYVLHLKPSGNYSLTAEAPGHLFRTMPLRIGPADGQSSETSNPDTVSFVLSNAHGTTTLLVFFGFNDATLAPESAPELLRVIRLMAQSPDLKVEVAGHTDNVGTPSYNQNLSERRAQAVQSYLAQHGIEKSRIDAIGKGETEPVAPNTTDEGRAQNRRVELKVK